MNRNLKRNLIQRFSEAQQEEPALDTLAREPGPARERGWFKFIKTAEKRKRQILEKMLLDQE